MRTEQLYYVLMVAKTGSFSKAADLLFIKQQSVREAINNLEGELDIILFDRHKRGVSLTQQGHVYLKEFREIIKIYESIKHHTLTTDLALQKYQLRLGVNGYTDIAILNKSFITFNKHYPDIILKIFESNFPNQLIEKIISNQLDLALTTIAPRLLKSDPLIRGNINRTIKIETLYTENIFLLVAKNHPLALVNHFSLEDIFKYTLVTLPGSALIDYLQLVTGHQQSADVVVSSDITVQTHHILHNMAVGFSIADASDNAFSNDEFCCLPLNNEFDLAVVFIYPMNTPISSAMYAYIDLVKSLIESNEII